MAPLRYSCSSCGAWLEVDPTNLFGWEARKRAFNERHYPHPSSSPVTLRLTLSEGQKDGFSAVFQRHGLTCHQVAPVTDGSKAFFLSKGHADFSQAVRVFANSPDQLEARLPPGLR